MTKEQALSLIFRYQYESQGDDGLSVLHTIRTRFPADGSQNKAMRWLGFSQGCVYQAGKYTLDDLKEHSREITSSEP